MAELDGGGGRAEEAVRLFLLRAGDYFVVRGVKVVSEEDVVTDIDIWAYAPGSLTHRERVVVDCKYKRAHTQGFERLVWLEGVRRITGAEHAILATTDARNTVRALATRHQVRLFGADMFDKWLAALPSSDRLTEEELLALVIPTDDKFVERTRERLDQSKTMMLRLDWDSANSHVEDIKKHAEDLTKRKVRSASVRLIYLSSAFFLIALDSILRDAAFLDSEKIRARIEEGMKYGTRGKTGFSALLNQFAKNKRPEALRLAEQIPADIPADFFHKHAGTGWLFKTALVLEAAAYSKSFIPTPKIGADAQSALGILLDFIRVDRRVVFDVTVSS